MLLRVFVILAAGWLGVRRDRRPLAYRHPAVVRFQQSSSGSSSAPAVQTGLIIVDDPSPADGWGSYCSAARAEMSPDSAHTHCDAPSSVCTCTSCTRPRSDDPQQVGRFFEFIVSLVLCYQYCFCANLDGNVKTGLNHVSQMLPQEYTTYVEYRVNFVPRVLGV